MTYWIEDIVQGKYNPYATVKGRFYFPEHIGDELVVWEYHDPNPKGRKRKETVMNEKLPLTNRLIKFDLDFKEKFSYKIQEEGEVICCTQNQGTVYFLHATKRMTILEYQVRNGD